jgi:uncharacterized protein (TIGR02284 family)
MKTKLYASGKKTLQVLNDLIRINIDRIAGLEKAAHIERTPELPLREAFYRMAIDARSYVNDLHAWVIRSGGVPVTQATITGKIYLRWLESQDGFDAADSLSAFGISGAAAEEAYRHALEEEHLAGDVHDMLENQLWSLQRSDERLLELTSNFNRTL